MDEMHVSAVDLGKELGKLIEAPLGGSPIEACGPIAGQVAQVAGIGGARPILVTGCGGETRLDQPSPQVVKDRVGYVDLGCCSVNALVAAGVYEPTTPSSHRVGRT